MPLDPAAHLKVVIEEAIQCPPGSLVILRGLTRPEERTLQNQLEQVDLNGISFLSLGHKVGIETVSDEKMNELGWERIGMDKDQDEL